MQLILSIFCKKILNFLTMLNDFIQLWFPPFNYLMSNVLIPTISYYNLHTLLLLCVQITAFAFYSVLNITLPAACVLFVWVAVYELLFHPC